MYRKFCEGHALVCNFYATGLIIIRTPPLRIFSEAQNLNFSRVFIIPNFSQQKISEFLLFFKIAPNLGSPEAVFWTKFPFPPWYTPKTPLKIFACGGLLLFSKSPKLNFSCLLIILKILPEIFLEFLLFQIDAGEGIINRSLASSRQNHDYSIA